MSLLGEITKLIKLGYPESTAKKIAAGDLPMDTESRMARAREQGFDVDQMYYHGSPDAQNIADSGFDPSYLGKGNDQLGSGFYFTTEPHQASGYAHGSNAGIIPAYLKAGRSNEVDMDAPAGFGIDVDEDTAFEILKRHPEVRDEAGPISNMFEPSDINGYTDDDIREAASLFANRDVDILQGDMFRHEPESFLNALTDTTGIDSIVTRSVRDRDPTVRTVFRPDQVRSPNAAFDPDYKGGNILGGVTGASGVLGALAAMKPEDALADGIGFEPQVSVGDYAGGVMNALFRLFGPEVGEAGGESMAGMSDAEYNQMIQRMNRGN